MISQQGAVPSSLHVMKHSTPTPSRPGNPRQQVTIPQAKGEGVHKTYTNRFAKKGQHVEKHQVEKSKSENFRKLVKKNVTIYPI